MAQDTGALKGLRTDRSPDNLLRSILLCLGCGYSLRRTAVFDCRPADLPRLSDVALLKRARKSKDWLHALCVRLFEELRLAVLPEGESQVVWTVDAATVEERRRRGSQWCVHYSVSLPSLACELLMLPKTEGPDMGKSLARFRDPRGRPCACRTRIHDGLGHSSRGGRGRSAHCACRYAVGAAVHGGRAAVRPAGGGDVCHTCGRRPVLGDHGRGPGRRRRPCGRGCGPGLRTPQVGRRHPLGAGASPRRPRPRGPPGTAVQAAVRRL